MTASETIKNMSDKEIYKRFKEAYSLVNNKSIPQIIREFCEETRKETIAECTELRIKEESPKGTTFVIDVPSFDRGYIKGKKETAQAIFDDLFNDSLIPSSLALVRLRKKYLDTRETGSGSKIPKTFIKSRPETRKGCYRGWNDKGELKFCPTDGLCNRCKEKKGCGKDLV